MKVTPDIKFIADEHKKKSAVLIRLQQFKNLMEEMEDLEDAEVASEITSKPFKTIPYEDVMQEIFGDDAKK